jgi:hypothetical protein
MQKYFLHPGYPKERISQVGTRSRELKICILDVLKCDFRDVDEAMLLRGERLSEIISYLLVIQISIVDGVASVIFK